MIENFLSEISKNKISFDKITSISFEVNQFKKDNPTKDVINGTIGMFYDDLEKPYIYKVVNNLFESFELNEISTYGFLYPTKMFTEGVLNLLDIDEKYRKNCNVFPSAGGLNALHHFMHNFVDSSTSVFALDPYWGPYQNIVGELGYKINPIKLYKTNNNLVINENLIIDCIMKSKDEKIVFIINIPCQNPTGFTPDLNELKTIKDSLIKLYEKGKKILIFFDLVYIHYSKLNINAIFDLFNDFTFFFNFSSSKTLSLYGFRTGAICLYTNFIEDKMIFEDKISYSARASTGSINNLGYKIVEKFSEINLVKELKNDWSYIRQELNNRASKFLKIISNYGFKNYRYDEGFFISFYHEKYNIENLYNILKENGIFFIPQQDSIRAAISSIPLYKIDEFEKRIKKINSAV